MDRISTATRALNLFGAGKHGFRDGNLSAGIAATDLVAEWFNGIQEELLAVIESAGLVPDANNRAQLLAALNIAYRMPVGAVGYFLRSTPPPGWMRANGSVLSRATYGALFAEFGTTHGAGDGVTTFGTPDLRGVFPRGLDDGRGIDVDRLLGSLQKGTILAWDVGFDAAWSMSTSETTAASRIAMGADAYNPASYPNTQIRGSDAPSWQPIPGGSGGAGGTGGYSGVVRPTNVALLACIKY